MRLIFSYRNYIQIQNKKQGLQLVIAPKSYAPRSHIERAREKRGHHAGHVDTEMRGQTQSHLEQREVLKLEKITTKSQT